MRPRAELAPSSIVIIKVALIRPVGLLCSRISHKSFPTLTPAIKNPSLAPSGSAGYTYLHAVWEARQGTSGNYYKVVETPVAKALASTAENVIPREYVLSTYPNPFSANGTSSTPSTQVYFAMKEAGPATVRIYNLRGQLVRELLNAYRESESPTCARRFSKLAKSRGASRTLHRICPAKFIYQGESTRRESGCL